MILEPGTFKTSDYRVGIPLAVKLAVMIRQKGLDVDGVPFTEEDASEIQFDHRPALNTRQYDTQNGDFIPPQNDPAHIVATHAAKHLEKTTGRKAGAQRTVTTRGSDVGEAARAKSISDSTALHRAKVLLKGGDKDGAADALASIRNRRRLKPKRKIANRGFPKQHRPMRSA